MSAFAMNWSVPAAVSLSGLGQDASSVLVGVALGLASFAFLPDAPLFFAAPETQSPPLPPPPTAALVNSLS